MLTDAEKVEIRRYLGFPVFGQQLTPGFGYRYNQEYLIFEYRLNNLQSAEEDQIRDKFLPKLRQLEEDIYGVRENSDTSRAAVWYRNSSELRERVQNFNYWSKQLADFLGVVPLNPKSISMRFVV